MAELLNAEIGTIGLIQQQENGDICQIGLTSEQSKMLQIFLASLSKESPLLKLGKEYNLTIKYLENDIRKQTKLHEP